MPYRARFTGLPALVAWACLVALVLATLGSMQPPALAPEAVDNSGFSATRARAHVARLSRAPRPIGSPAALSAEGYIADYLVALGLRVEHQGQPACTLLAGLRQCGHVRNVIATLQGNDSNSAVLLSAHYDSLPNSPGAADDAAGVAALMETARALVQGPRLRHDVTFAFVDGEEDLLLGSAAFASSTLFDKVRVVANFEARGSRGVSALVGVSPGSAALVEQFGVASRQPALSSLYCAVAELLPNGTDAELYGRAGPKTLSFAFIDGFENYHQGTDSLTNLDLRSLQHHGDNALTFAKHFANADLDQLSRSRKESVFFDLLGTTVVSYPYWVARASALLALLLVAMLCVNLGRSQARAARQIALAASWFAGSLVVIALVLAGLDIAIKAGWPAGAASVHRATLLAYLTGVGLVLFGFALASQARRFGARAVALAPLLVWACLALATAAWAPGATHVFVWPLLGAALSQLLRGRWPFLRLLLLAPAVIGATQLCFTLLVVLNGQAAFVPAVYVLFALGLLVNELEPLSQRVSVGWRLYLPLCAVGAFILGVFGWLSTAPPIGSSVAYAIDSNRRQAFWVSSDRRLSRYTKQFLGSSPVQRRSAELAASTPLFESRAPFRELAAPQLELLSQSTTPQGRREVVVRARSARAARQILIWEASGADVENFHYEAETPLSLTRFSEELDTKLFRWATGVGYTNGWTVLLLAAPPSGGTLRFETRSNATLELHALDKSDGLPFLPPGTAPRDATGTVGPPGDQVWVTAQPLRVAPLARGSLD
jgi:hypothetical protein